MDVEKNLKHKKEDISLEELGNNLRVEEDCDKQEVKGDENIENNSEKFLKFPSYVVKMGETSKVVNKSNHNKKKNKIFKSNG